MEILTQMKQKKNVSSGTQYMLSGYAVNAIIYVASVITERSAGIMQLTKYTKLQNNRAFLGMLASDIQYLVGGKVHVDFNWHFGEVEIWVKNDDIEYCKMSITLERYLNMRPHALLRKFLQMYDAEMRIHYDTLLKLRKESV